MGAGVNSVAGLIRYVKEYDAVIFADTHDEHVETYEYIGRYIIPFCALHKIPFIITGLNYSVLEGAERHKSPQMFFWTRDCSRMHKIRPILRCIRKTWKPTYKKPCLVDVCFAADESHRIGQNYYPKYAIRNFPLVDDKISRAGCITIIKDMGWETPSKSGCDHCFMAGRKNMKKLLYTHPERVKRLAVAEQHDKMYPRRSIFEGMTLQSLIDRMESNSVMEDFFDEVDADSKDKELEQICAGGCNQ